MNVRYASTVTSKSIIKNLKSLNAALAMRKIPLFKSQCSFKIENCNFSTNGGITI